MDRVGIMKMFEDKFGYSVDFDELRTTKEKAYNLINKSIHTDKDYIRRYIKRDYVFEDLIKEMVHYIAEEEWYTEHEDITEVIMRFAFEKEVRRLSVDHIYAIIHHLYKLIQDYISENNNNIRIDIEKSIEIRKFKERSLKGLVEHTISDLWIPKQLVRLKFIDLELSDIVKKIASSGYKITTTERDRVENIENTIDLLRDELELNTSDYRRIEDVEYIWNMTKEHIMKYHNYILNDT